jgi:ABC-2 type transport system ATP-binding protein
LAQQSGPAVLAVGLHKTFGHGPAAAEAVKGVSFEVLPGTVLGLLGPNGAGKTTTIRMLTTTLSIDAGSARVAGLDVATNPADVRRRIGLVGQLGGADPAATGVENLVLQGQLQGMRAKEARRRAAELADQLELASFAARPVRTWSGGQRRRLEVALGIVHRPAVLFLDEPTTGLDPQNRANLWAQVQSLRDTGTAVVLTTHYLDEADELADRVAIMDRGVVVAEGAPEALRRGLGRAAIVLDADLAPEALASLGRALASSDGVSGVEVVAGRLRLGVADRARALPAVALALEARGVAVRSISMAEPTLDDVFLQETGRSLRDAVAANGAAS